MAVSPEEVAKAYKEILGREADTEGLNHWVNSGLPIEQIRSELGGSGEGKRNTINMLYQEILGRGADETGMSHYMNMIDQGGWGADQIRGDLGKSEEFNTSDRPLMNDPAYNAFARAAQLEEASINNDTQARRDAMGRAQGLRGAQYDQQRTDAEKGHNRDFESRGMYRAGERLGRIADDQNRISSNQAYEQHTQAETLAAADRDAASRIAGIRRNTAEQGIAARDRIVRRNAERVYS